MFAAASSSSRGSLHSFSFVVVAMILALAATVGCGGSSGSGGGGEHFSGSTNVTLLLSSTANDQLSQFDLEFQTLTLTDQSGNIVNLISGNQPSESIHLNAGIEPLTTVSIPQGIYTSATATIGGAQFTCITQTQSTQNQSGGIDLSTYAYGYTPNSQVTVTLPGPITITGNSMAVSLSMQVSQSAIYSSCYPSGTYSITPTFTLAPLPLATQPTNTSNGKAVLIDGEVAAISSDGAGFTLALNEFAGPARNLTISTDSNTSYQGVSGFSGLQPGTLVEMDGALQSDGSLRATRIAAYDPAALNVMVGPVLFTSNATTDFYSYPRLEQGADFSVQAQGLGVYSSDGNTSFQISGALNNLAILPFAASFTAANMVPGQNVAVYSGHPTAFNGGDTTLATTIALVPQTINATVISSSTVGSFTDYAVVLESDDLIPTLAVQPGQTTLLTNPDLADVYVDSNTQMVGTSPLAPGSTLRFLGLMFNDSGALRMDCLQVSDGVTAVPQSNTKRTESFRSRQVSPVANVPGLPQVIRTITRSH